MSQQPKRRLNPKIENGVVLVLILSGATYVLIRYASLKDYRFWVAATVELGLACLTLAMPRRWAWIRLAIALFSVAGVPILGEELGYPRSTLCAVFVYIVVVAGTPLVGGITGKKVALSKFPVSLKFMVLQPAYLPEGFTEIDRNWYRIKGHMVVQMIYKNADDGSVLWIEETDGALPDFRLPKHRQAVEKRVTDVLVHFEVEMLKPQLGRNAKRETPFIEARWSFNGVNHSLRSDGLLFPEIERVIESMTVDPTGRRYDDP